MHRVHLDRKAQGTTSSTSPRARATVSQPGERPSTLRVPQRAGLQSWSGLDEAMADDRRARSKPPREEMRPKIGHDFSKIRIHCDEETTALTESLDEGLAAIPEQAPSTSRHHTVTRIDRSRIRSEAHRGLQGAGQPLPHLDRIQAAFGPHSLFGVRAFIDTEACGRVGADAYASGESIAFARPPDLRTAAHEAAHVIQQRHGVMLREGIGMPGDAYERHADAVADRVVQGERAAPLLTSFVGGIPSAAPCQTGSAVQMGVKSALVKAAVKAMSYAIRHGGRPLSKVVRNLDDDAARVFSRYTDDIADALDDIANIPDLATHIVREKLFNYLFRDLAINPGSAEMIADAVEAALWLLL